MERLRQERETFEVRKSQSRWWFGLRFATVVVLLAMALGIFGVATSILLAPDGHSQASIWNAGLALVVDLLALAGTGVAHVLRPATQPALAPVTPRSPGGAGAGAPMSPGGRQGRRPTPRSRTIPPRSIPRSR